MILSRLYEVLITLRRIRSSLFNSLIIGNPLAKISQKGCTSCVGNLVQLGSGSHGTDGPFQFVVMEKEVQTSNMHQRGFREEIYFIEQITKILPKCIN